VKIPPYREFEGGDIILELRVIMLGNSGYADEVLADDQQGAVVRLFGVSWENPRAIEFVADRLAGIVRVLLDGNRGVQRRALGVANDGPNDRRGVRDAGGDMSSDVLGCCAERQAANGEGGVLGHLEWEPKTRRGRDGALCLASRRTELDRGDASQEI